MFSLCVVFKQLSIQYDIYDSLKGKTINIAQFICIGINVYTKYIPVGCIWQLLQMSQKAAKLLNYCILHWRLNALVNVLFLHDFFFKFHALTSVFKKGEAGPHVKE